MKLHPSKFFTPEVRMFFYGAVAAILTVFVKNNWIDANLAQSINDNLPAIIGGIGAIVAAIYVPKTNKVPVEQAPVTPDSVDRLSNHMGVAQAPAVEES